MKLSIKVLLDYVKISAQINLSLTAVNFHEKLSRTTFVLFSICGKEVHSNKSSIYYIVNMLCPPLVMCCNLIRT